MPSRTTLLGLVKHATFVEKVWFDEAFTGRPRGDRHPGDAGRVVRPRRCGHRRVACRPLREACAASRVAAAVLGLDDVVTGNRRGPLPLRWIFLHLLRELAQHCGHADILREQILAARVGQ